MDEKKRQQLLEEFPLLRELELDGVDTIRIGRIDSIWLQSAPVMNHEAREGLVAGVFCDGQPRTVWQGYTPARFMREAGIRSVQAGFVYEYPPGSKEVVVHYLKPPKGIKVMDYVNAPQEAGVS